MSLEYVGIDRSERREVWRLPTWEDVVRALDLLDGRETATLTLAASDETYMTVAGGEGGLYVVGATFASGRFAVLVDEKRAGGTLAAVVARKPRELASEMGVDRETMLKAALRFYRSATLDPALSWVTA